MKSGILVAFATAGLVLSGAVMAADLPDYAKKKCGTCHAVDKKGIGPSYMEIANKYKGDSDAAGKIAASVTKGGALGWNMGKMPPKGIGASPEQIKEMADYIAGLAK